MVASPTEILLFEDDPAQAQMIMEMLAESRKPKFTVHLVRNLAEGLSLLRSQDFDAIMTDLSLSDSKGLETALAIRNQARQAPIIAITALDNEDVALEALQSDIQDYLIKGEISGSHLKRSVRYAMQRKHDMDALRQSEQRFASFMRHLPAPAWIKDSQGRYVLGNREIERLYLMPFSEFSGKTDDEILPLETARQFRKDDQQVLTTGESLLIIETPTLTDGTDHSFLVSKFPLPGPDGGTAFVGGIALDITDRVKAEEAVQKSEKKFATVFQEAPALLAVSSLEDGRIVDVNKTIVQTLGYQRDEMIGHTALEIGLWDDLSVRTKILETLAETGSAKKIEVRIWGKNGQSHICLFSGEYINIDGDRYLLSLGEDITLIRLAQEQVERLNAQLSARAIELEDANRELEAFNYTVAHDLRNPLNLINGYCQIVMRSCGDKLSEECRGYHQRISDAVVRMGKLISALLDFSRIAHAELHRERCDISAMAQSVAAELRLSEPERAADFRISDGVVVEGDPELLQVVLNNLLGNAWKYTAIREQTIIDFGVTEINGQAACFVRDNGTGFDAVNASKLFIPFQRLAETAGAKGFGIGLATVERIIRRHGGRIWAEGEPGRGATFYFTLPS